MQDRRFSSGGGREVMDRLNENNRILTEARMLPKKARLTDEQIQSVIAQFNRFTDLHKIPVAKAAIGCDYSSTVLSEWKSGKYKGDRTAITYAVNNWLELEARRIAAERPSDFISTTVAEDMRSIAKLAHTHKAMAAIVAPSGCGKTKVLQVLKEEMNGVLITCRDKTSSMILLRAIARELGFKVESAPRARLYDEIIDRLKSSNRPIFIDEAHRVGRDIGCLRSIYDEAGVPIIMVGTDEILEYIDDRSHGRGQFARRCLKYNAMDDVRDVGGRDGGQSGRDLFTVEEVRSFFEMKQIRLASDDALMLLWALSCLPGYGSLGMALMVGGIASQFADEEGLTAELIHAALAEFFGRPRAREVKVLAHRQLDHLPAARAAG